MIFLPPFLLVRLARGLWLRALGVGEELAALAGGVGEPLSKELCPDWTSAGGVSTLASSGVLARVSGRLISTLVFSLGSGWESVFARTTIGLLAFAEESLASPVKS